MDAIKISLSLLFIASGYKSESRTFQTFYDTVPWFNLKQPARNHHNCFCYPDPENYLKVSEILSPYHIELERIVIYLYRDPHTNEIKLYIPNKTKQELIPELAFEVEDKLVAATDIRIIDVFNTYSNELKLNIVPQIPYGDDNYKKYVSGNSNEDSVTAEYGPEESIIPDNYWENIVTPNIESFIIHSPSKMKTPHRHGPKHNDHQFFKPDEEYQSSEELETWSHEDDSNEGYVSSDSDEYSVTADSISEETIIPGDYWKTVVTPGKENFIVHRPSKIKPSHKHDYKYNNHQFLKPDEGYQSSKVFKTWQHEHDSINDSVTAKSVENNTKEAMNSGYYLENEITPNIENVIIHGPSKIIPSHQNSYTHNNHQFSKSDEGYQPSEEYEIWSHEGEGNEDSITAESVSKVTIIPGKYLETEVTSGIDNSIIHRPSKIKLSHQYGHKHNDHQSSKSDEGSQSSEEFGINGPSQSYEDNVETIKNSEKVNIIKNNTGTKLSFNEQIEKNRQPNILRTNVTPDDGYQSSKEFETWSHEDDSNEKYVSGDSDENSVNVESGSEENMIPGDYWGSLITPGIDFTIHRPNKIKPSHQHGYKHNGHQFSKPDEGYKSSEASQSYEENVETIKNSEKGDIIKNNTGTKINFNEQIEENRQPNILEKKVTPLDININEKHKSNKTSETTEDKEKSKKNWSSKETESSDMKGTTEVLESSKELSFNKSGELTADEVPKSTKEIIINGKHQYVTFDMWFLQQMQRFKKYKEHDTVIKMSTIERYVRKILSDNDMLVTDEGVLTDSYGTALDLHNLYLRPIFIGIPIDLGNFWKYNKQRFVVPSDLPYLQAILVSYAHPSIILGIIPMGKTFLPPSAMNTFSATFNKSPQKSEIQTFKKFKKGASITHMSLPELLHKKHYHLLKNGAGKKTPVRINNIVDRNSNRYLREADPNNYNHHVTKSMHVYDSDGNKLDDDSAEIVMEKMISAYRSGDFPSEWTWTSSSEDDVDDEDIAGRIIGGNAATSSGTPLSVRGRIKDF